MRRGVDLKFTPQYISDVILIEPTFQEDDRGYFGEIFRKARVCDVEEVTFRKRGTQT